MIMGFAPYSNINILVTPRTPQVSLMSKVIEYIRNLMGMSLGSLLHSALYAKTRQT